MNQNLRIEKIQTLINGVHIGLTETADGTTVGEVISAVATVLGQLIDVVISAEAGADRERNITITRATLNELMMKTADITSEKRVM